MLEKWIDEYINGADISKIRWLYYNNYGLSSFFKDNYYDNKLMMYIHDEKNYIPIGMHYIDYGGFPGFNYLIGVCPNKVGKTLYFLVLLLSIIISYLVIKKIILLIYRRLKLISILEGWD